MTREELIAALEKATGPSKQLDSAIYAELRQDGWTPEEWATTIADVEFINPSIPGVLAYTASLDAALTLVPETDGKRWYEIGQAWSQAVARVRIYPPSPWEGRTREAAAEASTPAIALCIAALRARA